MFFPSGSMLNLSCDIYQLGFPINTDLHFVRQHPIIIHVKFGFSYTVSENNKLFFIFQYSPMIKLYEKKSGHYCNLGNDWNSYWVPIYTLC